MTFEMVGGNYLDFSINMLILLDSFTVSAMVIHYKPFLISSSETYEPAWSEAITPADALWSISEHDFACENAL